MESHGSTHSTSGRWTFWAAGCGALALAMVGLGAGKAALSEGKGGDTMSLEEGKKEIVERLRRVSPSMPEIMLPWSLEAGEGVAGQTLRVSCNPDSDLFCLLLTAVLQLSPISGEEDMVKHKPRSLVGAVRIWDDEATSTGIQVSGEERFG